MNAPMMAAAATSVNQAVAQARNLMQRNRGVPPSRAAEPLPAIPIAVTPTTVNMLMDWPTGWATHDATAPTS